MSATALFRKDPPQASPREATVDLEIVVPVLNEERRIRPTLEALTAYLAAQPTTSRVTVVDNGCTDRTTETVDRLRPSNVEVRVIGCARPGKGAAVRKGMLAADARFVGFYDADLSTPVDTIGHSLRLMEEGWPVVIASRRCAGAAYGAEQPVLRRAGGLAFRSMARGIAPGVADTQCGCKFFSAQTARLLFSKSIANGYAFDVEIIGLARSAGLDVREIPVLWEDDSDSTFRPLTDGRAAFRELWALRGRMASAEQTSGGDTTQQSLMHRLLQRGPAQSRSPAKSARSGAEHVSMPGVTTRERRLAGRPQMHGTAASPTRTEFRSHRRRRAGDHDG
jgi:hypothetical protein